MNLHFMVEWKDRKPDCRKNCGDLNTVKLFIELVSRKRRCICHCLLQS